MKVSDLHSNALLALGFVVSTALACQKEPAQYSELAKVAGDRNGAGHVAPESTGPPPRDLVGVSSSNKAQPATPPPRFHAPYKRGNWRLASARELDHVAIRVQHLLVRHAGSERKEAPLHAPGWYVLEEPPKRTAGEAKKLAYQLSARITAGEDFTSLIRAYSEDAVTRDQDGRLPVLRATDFTAWPQLVDAFQALPIGEVSQPVETSFGFHLVAKLPPLEKKAVAGERIVIGYDEATWLKPFLRAGRPRRHHSEAIHLAQRLMRRLRDDPKLFPEFVKKYSDHEDAAYAGDFGAWSTDEPSLFPHAVQALSRLPVGGISDPVDTPFGIQIVRRTDDTSRERVAFDAVRFAYRPDAKQGSTHSRTAVAQRAKAVAEFLRQRPEQFSALQRKHCCTLVESWTVGQRDHELTEMLRHMKVDQVGLIPFERYFEFLIVRRLDATKIPVTPVRFDLPNPTRPDLERLVGRASGPGLARLTERFSNECLESQFRGRTIPPGVREAYGRLQKRFSDAKTSAARIQAFEDAQFAIRHSLGSAYDKHLACIESRVSRLVLGVVR
jgi:hypothetical protein